MISIDPARAKEDPIIVKNIPFYKAKKALEAEVMKLDPPRRPENWGVRILPYIIILFPLLNFLSSLTIIFLVHCFLMRFN